MTDFGSLSHGIHQLVDEHAYSRVLRIMSAVHRSPLHPTRTLPRETPVSRRRATVSVVIPCHNYGRYLEAAVDSVVTQQDVDVQVIIVNDHSPDNTAEIADRRAARRSPG